MSPAEAETEEQKPRATDRSGLIFSWLYGEAQFQYAVRRDRQWFRRKRDRKWLPVERSEVPETLTRIGGVARLPQ